MPAKTVWMRAVGAENVEPGETDAEEKTAEPEIKNTGVFGVYTPVSSLSKCAAIAKLFPNRVLRVHFYIPTRACF